MSNLSGTPSVSVALPVHALGSDAPILERAASCILRQTLRTLELLIILNGADKPTRATVQALAGTDPRIRILELPEANLADALNHALKHARHDLIARMDADDACPADRLERQAMFMAANPAVAAVGCAWELVRPASPAPGAASAADAVITTVRPPTDPAHLRWRLLLGNCLAHGSMMLQRTAILDAGGYDPACRRAQDYELWLRLFARGHTIACLPDVLYQHRVRDAGDPGRSTSQQADVAAPLMLDAWRSLGSIDDRGARSLASALAAAVSREGGPGPSTESLENLLATNPSREGLLAWLWAQWHHPPMNRRAAEICRLSRLREVGAAMRAAGASDVYLWGAGDHTRWILEHRADLSLPIAGLIDDQPSLAGEVRYGERISHPASLRAGDFALISSDWHEDRIWDSSAPHRARGVNVWRLYG